MPVPCLNKLFMMFAARAVDRRGYLDEQSIMTELQNPAHENWAKRDDVQQLLGYMLNQPFADHTAAVHAVLGGDLCVAHAVGLVRVSTGLDWTKANWKPSATRNKGVAYHVWLYHFLGGAPAKLRPPPTCTTAEQTLWSCTLRRDALIHEKEFTRELKRIKGHAGRPEHEAELIELRCRLFDADVLRAAAPDPMQISAGGGDGSPPPGSGTEWQQQTDALVAFAMGTHSRLGEGYAHVEGPCAVRLLAGNFDMLRQIAARFRGVQPRQLAPPDREQLRLRRLNWQLELELQAERAASSALATALADSQRAATRALEREAAAVAKLGRGQQRAEIKLERQERAHAAESRQLGQEMRDLRSELSAEWRSHRKELTDMELGWQQELEAHEAETIERLRDQEHELREYQQRMYHERNKAAAEAADRAARVEDLSAALERLRSSSKNGLLTQVAELQAKVRELGARRTLNQRRLGDANLADQRTKVAQGQAAAAKAALREYGVSAEAERAAVERAEQLEKQVRTTTLPCQHVSVSPNCIPSQPPSRLPTLAPTCDPPPLDPS
jgi:hypothetical protein